MVRKIALGKRGYEIGLLEIVGIILAIGLVVLLVMFYLKVPVGEFVENLLPSWVSAPRNDVASDEITGEDKFLATTSWLTVDVVDSLQKCPKYEVITGQVRTLCIFRADGGAMIFRMDGFYIFPDFFVDGMDRNTAFFTLKEKDNQIYIVAAQPQAVGMNEYYVGTILPNSFKFVFTPNLKTNLKWPAGETEISVPFIDKVKVLHLGILSNAYAVNAPLFDTPGSDNKFNIRTNLRVGDYQALYKMVK